jgi:hypothetical protein
MTAEKRGQTSKYYLTILNKNGLSIKSLEVLT